MPDLGISEIISIIGAVVGAGSSIYGLATRPGTPKSPTAPTVTPADALKTRTSQEAALSQQFPGIQAATGGSLSPESWIRLAELLTGKAGETGIGSAGEDLLKKTFNVGVGGGGSSGSTGSAGLTPAGSTYG